MQERVKNIIHFINFSINLVKKIFFLFTPFFFLFYIG
jgi:hypothetical protein